MNIVKNDNNNLLEQRKNSDELLLTIVEKLFFLLKNKKENTDKDDSDREKAELLLSKMANMESMLFEANELKEKIKKELLVANAKIEFLKSEVFKKLTRR